MLKYRPAKVTATSHGLHCWYKAMIEKLGWVILGQQTNPQKPVWYIKSLNSLKLEIENWMKLSTTQPLDIDLQLMVSNLNYLINCNISSVGQNSTNKYTLTDNSNCDFVTVTSHGLNCWYTAMIEKLGWVVLRQQTDPEKCTWYVKSLNALILELKNWIKISKSKPLDIDLQLMVSNLKYILNHNILNPSSHTSNSDDLKNNNFENSHFENSDADHTSHTTHHTDMGQKIGKVYVKSKIINGKTVLSLEYI